MEERTAELVQRQANCSQLPGSSLAAASLRSVPILARTRLPLGCLFRLPAPTLPYARGGLHSRRQWFDSHRAFASCVFVARKGPILSPEQLLEEHGALAFPPLPDPHGSSQQS